MKQTFPEAEIIRLDSQESGAESWGGLLTDEQIEEYAVKARNEIPAITPEFVSAVSRLDSMELGPTHSSELVDLVGVIAGVKPACYIGASEEILDIAEGANLSVSDAGKGRYTISRDSVVAEDLSIKTQKMRDLNIKNQPLNEALERSIGISLGYPKASIDFFIDYTKGDGYSLLGRIPKSYGDVSHFGWFIMPTDQAGMEAVIKEHAEPLREAVEIMTPDLYNRIIEIEKTTS